MYFRERTAARLSPSQADMLLRHIDGPRQIVLRGPARLTMSALIERGFLVFCRENGVALPSWQRFPRFARLTDDGREIVACLLAMQADRLAALGCSDPSAPSITVVPDCHAENDADQARVHDEGRRVRAALP